MARDTRLSDVLHVLLHMAQVDSALTSEVLARSMGTNPAVFRRMMSGLRDAGIVASEKGRGGGWSLSRSIDTLTLWDVYRALGEPTLFAIGSRKGNRDCLIERGVNAALGEAMRDAQTVLKARLQEVTLDTLLPAKPAGGKSLPYPH